MCVSFIILFLIMWVFAAFGEEFLFGGYYIKHFAEFLGDTNKSRGISTIILSIYFGVSHNYQETTDLKSVDSNAAPVLVRPRVFMDKPLTSWVNYL